MRRVSKYRLSARRRLKKNLKRLIGDRPETEFAKRVGLSQSTLNRIMRLEQNVTIDTLDNLARALCLDLMDLLRDED